MFMRKSSATFLMCFAFLTITLNGLARNWSLQDCINYALQNNITLQKQRIQKQSANEDFLQAKAALLPDLGFSSRQNLTYTPWIESASAVAAILEVLWTSFTTMELMD